MNEILYADCDTDHFKKISGKVWVLAPQPIYQHSGSAKQTSLSAALQSACRFKHEALRTKKRTIRFVPFHSALPQMMQTTVRTSQPSSLSRALKKAVQIKNGKCSKIIGAKMIEGATVWTLTPEPTSNTKRTKLSSSFLAALKRLPDTKTSTVDVIQQIAPFQDEPLLSVVASTYHTYQGLAATV